ncbi:MAG: HAMP domain-containing sensor histidine kinase [Bacteroidota bacterium]
MNKVLFIIFSIGVAAILTNHYLFSWEHLLKKNAEAAFAQIISEQRNDLEKWIRAEATTSQEFNKRRYCEDEIVQWSINAPTEIPDRVDSIVVFESDIGIILSQSIKKGRCYYISNFRLTENYKITNKYLKRGKSNRLPGAVNFLSSEKGPINYKDLLWYDLKIVSSSAIDAVGILLVLVVILYAFWLNCRKLKFGKLLVAILLLIVFRLLSLYLAFFEFVRYPAFNPVNYTSSWLNPTLGSLIINIGLLLLITFLLFPRLEGFRDLRWAKRLFHVLCNALVLSYYLVVWDILRNSQLSLDIGATIQFDAVRFWSFVGIVGVATSYFFFNFFSQRVFDKQDYMESIAFSAILMIASAFFNPLIGGVFAIQFLIMSIASFRIWKDFFYDFGYSHLLYILAVSACCGIYTSIVIYKHHEKSELESKKKFANYILLKRDVIGEYYFDQAVKSILTDTELEEIASERSREMLEEEISKKMLSPYFHKYDLEVVFQDFQKFSINSEFAVENAALTVASRTGYENIFFVDEGANFKYVCKIRIGKLIGLVILKIKRRVPNTVFPELLKDAKYFSVSDDFDYAVFSGDEILYHRSKFGQGEWPKNQDFGEEKLYTKGIEKNGRHYYGVKTNDGRTILIISNTYPLKRIITNASFMFLVLFISFSIFTFVRSLNNRKIQVGFTGKIQLYIGIAFILPLMAAALALLPSLNASYRSEIDRNYLKQALYISDVLVEDFSEGRSSQLKKKLADASKYLQNDISVFNVEGRLLATSQPEIYSLDLRSELINPMVFTDLVQDENQSIVVDESIGKLDFKVCYATIQGTGQQLYGFIAIPFFNSKNHLRRQQVEVFGNLILIFGSIFFLAVAFGHFIMNNLLYPLRMVADKIRKVTLRDVNNPIEYDSADEIGSLVKDYNQMLEKLEESKMALVKSQKEMAWKEIAKQVAHEIKNPLTPMQLKIQQLMRRKEKETKEYDTLNSLLLQIDTLSQIAESFSGFAEMPVPSNEKISFSLLVEEVGSLYITDDVDIKVVVEPDICIYADRDIFRSILNNIVLNAIQSVKSGRPKLDVTLKRKGEKAIFSITDNGEGIPEELSEKIFVNYFSTKSTGSGIGLALAKKGIENAGGNIWFESSKEGTTFFIAMPLVSD